MALNTNKIHGFEFVALLGNVVPPSYQIVTDDRPGVDGSEHTLIGNKGRPFTLLSMVDVADYAAAKVKFKGYRQLIEFDAVELIQGGVSTITDDDYKVKVLDVRAVDLRTIRGASGYKLDPANTSQGWCVCEWTLQSVPS